MSVLWADARALPLVDGCVQTCVTSPPYWGLRDYGHAGQLGLEQTPEQYVENMVQVFREVRRVLREDGTCWANFGDCYATGAGKVGDHPGGGEQGERWKGDMHGGHRGSRGGSLKQPHTGASVGPLTQPNRMPLPGLKSKDLVGIPWRVAFALQADGWYLRSDIIWSKPNPMPESVTDRPTKAHEYIFLLSKSERYFYDSAAIAEALQTDPSENYPQRARVLGRGGLASLEQSPSSGAHQRSSGGLLPRGERRNKRSVWTVSTQPYSGAHFATFPEKLIEPCILAGSRTAGKRCDCDRVIRTPIGSGPIDDPSIVTGRAGMNRPRRPDEGTRPITRREQRSYAEQMRISPFRAEMADAAGEAFAHYIRTDASGARPLPQALLDKWLAIGWLKEPEPCRCPFMRSDLVLDPFLGSGTTGAVAARLGRRWVGCDLAYHDLSKARTAQRGLLYLAGEATA